MPKFSESLQKIGPYLSVGGVFAGCLVIGVLLGHWLDGRLGTSPWLVLAGSLLGMVSGFYHFFKIVLRLDKKAKGDKNDHEQP